MMKFKGKNSTANNLEQKNLEIDDSVSSHFEETLLGEEVDAHHHIKATFSQTIFNIIKLFLGISILAAPHSYSKSGLIGGIIGIIVAAIWNVITVHMQQKAAERWDPRIRSLSQLTLKVLGPYYKFIVDILLMFLQIWLNISYLMFNGVQIDQEVCAITDSKIWGHKNSYIVIATLLMIPLCWIRHLKHLAYLSILMLIGMVATYLVILYYSGVKIINGDHHYDEIQMFDIYNYPFFVGIALLNFEGNPTSLNVRHSMKNPNNFIKSFIISAAIVTLGSMAVASVGYIAFGPHVNDIVLLELPHNDSHLVIGLIRFTYCLWLFGSYPIQMVAPIDIIEAYDWYSKLPNLKFFDIRYYAVRTFYVIWTGLFAIIIPKFGLFLDFIGSVGGTSVWFIFPIMIYETAYKYDLTLKEKIFNKFILWIGVIFGGISIVVSFVALILAF